MATYAEFLRGGGRGRPVRRTCRTAILPAALATVLVFGLALGGCGTRVRTVEQAGDFDTASLTRGKIALAGAMLGPRAELDRAAGFPEGMEPPGPKAQAEHFAPIVYREFLTARPDLVVWPWPAVCAQADTAVLAELLEDWAAGRVMQPQRIRDLAAPLAGAAFVALVRIDANEIKTELSAAAAVAAQQARDGRDVHDSGLARGGTTERKVTVNLELFDLRTGWPVWSATADARRKELYDFGEGSPQDKLVVKKDPAGGQADITVPGNPQRAPDLDEVFGDACRALIDKLPGSAPAGR